MKLQAESFSLATQAVDMRTGIDGLSLHVQQALGRAPCDGTAYVFSNRRRTRLMLGWQRRVDVLAPSAPGSVCLAAVTRNELAVNRRAMAMADRRHRLAAAGPARTSAMAAVMQAGKLLCL